MVTVFSPMQTVKGTMANGKTVFKMVKLNTHLQTVKSRAKFLKMVVRLVRINCERNFNFDL
jgi:hypothetical protein